MSTALFSFFFYFMYTVISTRVSIFGGGLVITINRIYIISPNLKVLTSMPSLDINFFFSSLSETGIV